MAMLLLLIAIQLVVIIWQDFKYRAISAWLIPTLLISGLVWSFQFQQFNNLIQNMIFNIGFVVIQLLLLSLYFSLKSRRFVNIVNQQLGLGDVLFFIPLTSFFSPMLFILFFCFSLTTTLVGFLIVSRIKPAIKTIPLAGAMSCWLTIAIVAHYFNHIHLYNDHLLFNYIN